MEKQTYSHLPLPQRAVPHPWEDLASVVARTARKMGYELPEWILRPESISHAIDTATLPLLQQRADYQLLESLLHLEEEHVYAMTVHRFAPQCTEPSRLLTQMARHSQLTIDRPLLEDAYRSFFLSRHMRVCPRCLDEQAGYDRLYWRCTLIFSCLRHNVFLISRCPSCHSPIPALRPSLTNCPTCHKGDYRSTTLSLLSEEEWLRTSQTLLHHQLGVDDPNADQQHARIGGGLLQQLPSWDYFWLLAQFSMLFRDSSHDSVLPYLKRTLNLEAIVSRLSNGLDELASHLLPKLLLHYLFAAWPLHFYAFLERLQRALLEEYHFYDESAITQSWTYEVVKGNYWCSAVHRTDLVRLLRPFFATYAEYFHHVRPAEKTEYRESTRIASGMIALPASLRRVISEEPALPQQWESLSSVIARTAYRKGYSRPELVLIPSGEYYRISLFPSSITLLNLRDDYRLLEEALCLDEETLYDLTLHRFASAFLAPSSDGRLPQLEDRERTIDRPLLSQEAVQRFCAPPPTKKICPACLDDEERYERLYWNIRSVLICPRHLNFLISRCPACHKLIPTFQQSSLTECPYCLHDYRRSERISLAKDSLLYSSQMTLLRFLGVDDLHGGEEVARLLDSPLQELQPWQYFHLLDLFGSTIQYLLPERALNIVCGELDFREDIALYRGRSVGEMAKQISLFHALFLSWPKYVNVILDTSSPLRKGKLYTSSKTFSDIEYSDAFVQNSWHFQSTPEDFFSLLLLLFKTSTRRSQDAAWKRDCERSL